MGTKKASVIGMVLNTVNEDFSNKEWMDFYGKGASEKIVEVLKNYG